MLLVQQGPIRPAVLDLLRTIPIGLLQVWQRVHGQELELEDQRPVVVVRRRTIDLLLFVPKNLIENGSSFLELALVEVVLRLLREPVIIAAPAKLRFQLLVTG